MPMATGRKKKLAFRNISFNLPRRKYFGQGEVSKEPETLRKTEENKRKIKRLPGYPQKLWIGCGKVYGFDP